MELASQDRNEHELEDAQEHEHAHAEAQGAAGVDSGGAASSRTSFTGGGPLPAVDSENTTPAPPPTASDRAYGSAVVVARRGLRVRSAPNLHAPIIASLFNGQTVQQVGRVGAWVQIEHGSRAAYVHSDYLRSSGNDTDAATQQSAPVQQITAALQAAPTQSAPVQQQQPAATVQPHVQQHVQTQVQPQVQPHVQPHVQQQAPTQAAATTQHAAVASSPVHSHAPTSHAAPQAQQAAPVQAQSASDRAFTDAGGVLNQQTERTECGIRIVAPAGVHTGALERAAAIVRAEIGRNLYAQQHLAQERTTIVIIPVTSSQTDLPQFASMRTQHTIDGRQWSGVRGSGGTRAPDGTYAIGIGEENLVEIANHTSGYNRDQVAYHEFSHAIHNKGMTSAQHARVQTLFNNMRNLDTNHDTSEFSDHYAATNAQEYFAQSTNVFFGNNGPRDSSGRVNGNGRDWLRVHDPDMYAFLVDIYETNHDASGNRVS
jgi:hypothetical protein